MALSGSFTGTTANQYVTPKIVWSATQDVVGNKSTITASLYYSKSYLSSTATGGYWGGTITIDGQSKSFGNVYVVLDPGGGDKLVATLTVTIDHNPDGSKKPTISATGYIAGTTLTSTSLSSAVDLDTIPRASSITCTTTNIESNPTITIYRASPSFTHTITYAFGNVLGTIVEKTSATSITNWTIPADFYTQIPNDRSGWGGLYCTTYNGTTEIGTTRCDLIVTTDETKCKPTVSGTVVDTNATTIALTGNKDILVRYCSTALCTLTATLNKNAGSIKSKTINNVAISGDTLTINNVETGTFDFYAKDSREYFNSDKEVKTLVPYIKLTNDATIYRDEPTSGDATLKIEGNYFAGSFGAKSNSITVRYRQGDGAYVSVTPTINNNKYSATVSLAGLDYTKSFNFEVIVSDAVSAISKPLTLQKGIPVFDWGENDFNFNVPISIYGTPIVNHVVEQGKDGIWTYRKWSDGTAECWGTYVQNNVAVESAWGSLVESAGMVVGLPSGLFVATPHFNVSFDSNLGVMMQVFSAGTTTNSPYFCAVRPYAGTIEKLNTSIFAFGRWK